MCPSMPQVPTPTISRACVQVGVVQKNGNRAVMIRLLRMPVRKLLVVGLSTLLSLRVSN
ncbi:hypothetical protein D3C86_1670820 [compost metagenome]